MKHVRIARRLALALASTLSALALAACATGTMPSSGSSGQSLSDMVESGISMQAERGSETLEIKRMSPGGTKPAKVEKDSWTVLVYLCGSDLESRGGAATTDLSEMVGASGSENVSFVVETGGAKSWKNNAVSPRQLGRYLVQNGSITEVGKVSAADMGSSSTLADFITWGVANYPADHMALILWNHGGGSITGVCFDERNNYDALSLREVDTALATSFTKMWDKFDFIGFDACLMGTLETANVMASYGDYMIASQESEPGSGWEYSSIIEYLSQNPGTTGKQLGKSLCNSYLSSLDRNSKGFATLSVVDLSKVDNLLQSYYRFSQEMYASSEDQATFAAMSRGIRRVDTYGSNNWYEGYTNMVDLGGLIDACSSVTPSAAEAKQALNDAIVYQIRGNLHAAASGLSTYYPLRVSDSKELSTFQSVAVNPSYLSYVDRLVHGATYNGGTQYQQYSNDQFFGSGGLWDWLLSNTQPTTQNGQQTTQQQEAEQYWDYVDDHSTASEVITFAEKPHLDDDGAYTFTLDQHGIDNASVISGIIYEISSDGKDLISLGETYDVYGDWTTGEFFDGFDGQWLSLPDGQNLCLTVVSANEDNIVFTSPITLNGKECYLRIRQNYKNGKVTVEGTWTGISANGVIDRGVTALKRGDVIVPRYKAFSADETVEAKTYEGKPYTVTSKNLSVDYSSLPDGTYVYGFCIQDAFGDYCFTETTSFEVDPDGTIYFTE